MGKRFPYIRLEGDKDRAEGMIRRARAELQRTKAVATRMGVADYQRFVRIDEDTYIITKVLQSGIEMVNIYAAPYVPRETITQEQKEQQIALSRVYSIYSGFVYEGWLPTIVDLDTMEDTWPELQQFNPTEWCRKTHPDDFESNLDYQNVPRLAVLKDPDYPAPQGGVGWYGNDVAMPPAGAKKSQYNSVRACAFTGLMAKAVSIISGYGTFNVTDDSQYDALLYRMRDNTYKDKVKIDAFQILYDSRFTRCHSITKGSDGALWLVETSVVNGVIATPLKYLNPSLFSKDPEEDWPVATAFQELGGLPSGESFPQTRAEVEEEIHQGRIIELMSPAAYDTAFIAEWREYSEDNCWAWNEDGTEGRVTAFRYYQDDINVKELGYLKIDVNIGKLNKNPPNVGNPVGSGTVSISYVNPPKLIIAGFKPSHELSPLYTVPPVMTTAGGLVGRGTYTQIPCNFYQRESGSYSTFNIATTNAKWNEYLEDLDDVMKAVIWVGYINGVWEEVWYKQYKFTDLEDYYHKYTQPSNTFIDNGGLDWNLSILVLKTPAINRYYWNDKNLPIIHWGHLYRTSDVSYSEEKYTQGHSSLRWFSLDSVVQTNSWNVRGGVHGYTVFSADTGSVFEDPPTYTTLYEFEVTYSASWVTDFPEFKFQVTIAPHNRSAFFFYEHEYYKREDGPSYIDDPEDANFGLTSMGTARTRFRVGSGKGIRITEELAWDESTALTTTLVSETQVPGGLTGILSTGEIGRPFPDSFPGDMDDPDNYYYDTGPYTLQLVGLDNLYTRITQNQSPGPYTYTLPKPLITDVHPNDFDMGYLLRCGDWHNRVRHVVNAHGERPSGYKETSYFTEGIPSAFIHEGGVSPSRNNKTIWLVWYPHLVQGASPPAQHCSAFGGSQPGPDSIEIGETEWTQSTGFFDPKSWPKLEADTHYDWKPYLKYSSYLLCDRIGKIQFQSKELYSENEDDDTDLADTIFHITTINRHCQHSTIGEPAAIFTDVDIQSTKGFGTFGMRATGVMPELPNTEGDDERFKFLTFIGVNSE